MNRTTTLWLGAGALALAQLAHPGPAGWLGVPAALAQQPAGADLGYATSLTMLAGHADVAQELVKGGHWDAALPHVRAMAEKVYPALEPELARRTVPPFKDQIVNLAKVVEAKAADNAYIEAMANIRKAINGAYTTIAEGERTSPGFMAALGSNLLQAAAESYATAVQDGKVENPVAYQNGWDYLNEAQQLTGDNTAVFKDKDGNAFERMAGALNRMAMAWPAPMPPATPVMGTDEVQAQAAAFRKAGEAFR